MAKHLPRGRGFPFRFGAIGPSKYYTLDVEPDKIRSPVSMALLREGVEKYGSNLCVIDDPLYNIAVLQVKRDFRLPVQARPIKLEDVLDERIESKMYTRSPGLPWIYHGYKSKRDVFQDPAARESITAFQRKVAAGENIKPADVACYARSHLVEPGDPYKVRPVWGVSATQIALEAQFAQPLINKWKTYSGPWSYGYETTKGGHGRICREQPEGLS